MGYHFDIQYWTGTSNKVADALSRVPYVVECVTLTTPPWHHWDDLPTELDKDPFLFKLTAGIEVDTLTPTGFSVNNGILYYKGKLVIPK